MPVVMENRFPTIRAELRPKLEVAIKEVAEAIVAEAKLRVPERTTELRDAIHAEPEGIDSYTVFGGNSKAWYGHFVEFGTASHEIPNAFGRGITVQHPGATPHPFLVPAAESQRDFLIERVQKVLRDL